MKNLVLLVTILTVVDMGWAQENRRLMGPAAKNYKIWLVNSKATTSRIVTVDQAPLMGPAAKNNIPKRHDESLAYTQVVSLSSRHVGPKAKNSSPFRQTMDLKQKKMLFKRRMNQNNQYPSNSPERL